jgi:hypothetical protein
MVRDVRFLQWSGLKITVFWDVTPCVVVDRYKYFGRFFAFIFRVKVTSSLKKQVRVHPKCWYLFTGIHGVTAEKIVSGRKELISSFISWRI